jgi:hypothetical protein
MKYIVILLLLGMPAAAMPQNSITEYTPAQRAALQGFIDKNPAYQFISETGFDEPTLKAARNE